MPFDSTVMRAVVAELNERLLGGRISKIYQPEPDELALLCYSGGANYRLLLSGNPRQPRLHLTAIEKKNPPAPPTFCMLLRKYIEGGRITAIRQVGRDRICRITVSVTDELGNPAEYILVAEVMGKHSNVVLLGPHGRIVDAVRRVTEEVNRHRELLPGLPYLPPPPVDKLDPAALTGSALAAEPGDPTGPAWQFLLDRVDGLGPMLAKEAVARAGYPTDAPLGQTSLERLAAAVGELALLQRYEPRLLYDEQGRLKEFHVLPLIHWPGREQTGFDSISGCLDAYYGGRAEEEKFRALRGSLAKLVRDETGRVSRKLKAQRESLRTAESAESYRLQGELITANLWQIKKGDEAATVVNYYEPDGGEMVIPLDPTLTPAENAQAYYRRYQKARSGLAMIQEQLARSEAELAYLEQVEVALDEASSLPDLEEIRRELIAEGYIGERREAKDKRVQKGDGNAKEQKAAPPLTIRSSDGLEIWVGRNNRQNDYLTMKLAAPHDLWFHTKEIPGSHVILRVPPGRAVPERAIHEAAALAAYHSKARHSSGVPVDYTLRKHVRKPSGARPGMVIYDNQKTLWVTPDPELIPILKGGAGHGGTGSDDRARGEGDRGAD
ncbi:MAG: Rqc2 family fibronectin-binding protein [Bacillota bacterium]